MKLPSDVGIWKIVAHIALKSYSVASGTFSTGSTFKAEQARPASFASRSEDLSQAIG
jgi:hypothetical protein